MSSSLLQSDRSIGSARSVDNSSVEGKSAVSMIGRFGWALADQVLSSATNFLLGLLVARTVGPRELGAFSMAYATFTFSLGAVRAIAGELLVVRHSAVSADEWRDGVKRAAGTALMAGIVVGIGCLIAGVTVGEPFRTVLSIVGISLPFLLVQDVWRFAFFARRRGSAAFLNDLVWAAVLFAAFAVLRYFDVVLGCVVHVRVGGRGIPCGDRWSVPAQGPSQRPADGRHVASPSSRYRTALFRRIRSRHRRFELDPFCDRRYCGSW